MASGRLFILAAVAVLAARPVAADVFDDHWRDGKAELDGYRLQVNRYGQVREGQAVLIYVTEPWSESQRVKVDDPAKNPADTFEALKLNLIRDFQTGIYDYNTMVSTFVRARDFSPVKVSMSSAEWCGHVYAEIIPRGNRLEGTIASYFQGESGPVSLDYPKDAVLEDNLFILIRGLRGQWLAPGESRSVPYLPGTLASRLSHQTLAWTRADITRLAKPEQVTVPAGTFNAQVYEVRVEGGRIGRFHVETEYPHRLVRWELPPDVSAELTGTLRVPYWKLNQKGGESNLRDLGLLPILPPGKPPGPEGPKEGPPPRHP